MTLIEWQALIELLNRTPMTQAERMWLQALIQRETARIDYEAQALKGQVADKES